MKKLFNIIIYILAIIGLSLVIVIIAEVIFYEELKGKVVIPLKGAYLFNLDHLIVSSLRLKKYKDLDIDNIPMYIEHAFVLFLEVIIRVIDFVFTAIDRILFRVLKEFCKIIYKICRLIANYYSSK